MEIAFDLPPEIISKPYIFPIAKNNIFMSAEMEEISKNFERLKDGQDSMIAKMGMMEDSLRVVKESVSGNPPMGLVGLAERMENMEEKIKNYDKIYYKVLGVSAVIGFLWTLFITILLKFWDKIF